MEFTSVTSLTTRKNAELLVLPFWKDKKQAIPAADFRALQPLVKGPLATEDFTGKEGEVAVIYVTGQKEPRIALLGLGEQEKVSIEKFRRAYANLAKACRARKIEEVTILPPHSAAFSEEDIVRGITEGLLLANYSFDKNKHDSIKEQPTVLLKKAHVIGISKTGLASAKKYGAIVEGVYLTRDLVNGNADDVTPQFLADVAKDMEKKLPHVHTTVFNKKWIEKEKMGLLLAVNRGSHRDPVFITIEYKGNPKSKERTALVGKGITFDTGGINLKPTGSGLESMRCDMGGAATVLGIIFAAASIGLKVNLIGIIASTENAIGPASYKPGDVYQGYSGKTVEIGNTDAEGRLILADALAYTVKTFKPTRIIDYATLTGAIDVALGAEATGLFSNDDSLAEALSRAGNETHDRVWRLPLFEEYREQLKSDIADMKNTGGRPAGSITAAHFLKEFVGDTPWAHCDIASTAFLAEPRRYNPKYATGAGVRLTIQFLEQL